jgi:hypothetical protein
MGFHLNVHKQPSLMAIYLRGLRPRAGLAPGRRVPRISLTWTGTRVDGRHLRTYLAACGLEASAGDQLPLLYPLALCFPLHLQLLTHPRFPLRFPRMLTVRSHISRHLPLRVDQKLILWCSLGDQRVLPGGLEVDCLTRITIEDGGEPWLAWENINVYYFPGRFGEPDAPSGFSRLCSPGRDDALASWRNRDGTGWTFARLSGDLNGLHYSSTYARMLGYEGDFSHAPAILSDSLGRLPPRLLGRTRLRLDAYFKGPVYYGREVALRGEVAADRARFDLHCAGNPRPCLSGELYANVKAGEEILSGSSESGPLLETRNSKLETRKGPIPYQGPLLETRNSKLAGAHPRVVRSQIARDSSPKDDWATCARRRKGG